MDQKKAAELASLSETVMAPDVTNPDSTILELDELWFFVANKTNQAWIWIALCRKNRKAGRLCHWRSQPSHLPPLVGAIPLAYGTGHCFTDFWRAYQAVIPEEQQTAVGKETGETERAGMLEQYAPTTLGLLMTRKTLSFSK